MSVLSFPDMFAPSYYNALDGTLKAVCLYTMGAQISNPCCEFTIGYYCIQFPESTM